MLTLYIPKLQDLWFREKMLNDEKTMEYNHSWGGTIPFPKYEWEQWHNKWISDKDNRYFYRYIRYYVANAQDPKIKLNHY